MLESSPIELDGMLNERIAKFEILSIWIMLSAMISSSEQNTMYEVVWVGRVLTDAVEAILDIVINLVWVDIRGESEE